jgi:cation-dependent mannose-6-phosphate receptor
VAFEAYVAIRSKEYQISRLRIKLPILSSAWRRFNQFLSIAYFITNIAMHFLSFQTIALSILALQSGLTQAATDEKKPPLPCTIQSPNTGSFFDLRPLSLTPPDSDKHTKGGRTESWKVKGYDYPTNFTMNICAPVIEEVKDVVGIKESLWKNISAYYEHKGRKYSIGYVRTETRG